MRRIARREQGLLISLASLVVLLNVPYGEYVLYPFALFSTWIHELCHGLAALVLGGDIERLQIFTDTSGQAITRRPDSRLATAIVASAGYLGTSIVGALLLSLRHAKGSGRIGVPLIGLTMVSSALLWVRNPFGFFAVVLFGTALVALGRGLDKKVAAWLFTFLAATICLNAITSIRHLFGEQRFVNGRQVGDSDAHTVAQALLLPPWFWASAWLLVALFLTALALASDSRRAPRRKTV